MKLTTSVVTLKRTDRLLQHLLPGPSAGPISPEVRLAIALRFLAGGQILDLRVCYHVSKSECCRSVWCVVDGVNGCAALQANAFNLEEWMMVPVNDGAHADFDYHQSSSRVVIERAFGILIRRWGIFWRPLEVQFRRRAPLIKCCMLLHNDCITKRITLDLCELHGLTDIQPRRWEKTPLFDKDGRPVEHLKTAPRAPGVPIGSRRSTKREALIAKIEERGLKRPKKRARQGGN